MIVLWIAGAVSVFVCAVLAYDAGELTAGAVLTLLGYLMARDAALDMDRRDGAS